MNPGTTTPPAPHQTAPWAAAVGTTPGALRVRPIPHEATTSYLGRLAATYRVSAAQLLDGLGIHLTTGAGADTAAPAAELHLTPQARQHLTAFTRIPLPHLARALPRLQPREDPGITDGLPAARCLPVPTSQQPVRACTACTAHRSHGATAIAWVYPPPPGIAICTRHQQATADPRHTTPLDIHPLPELTRTHHRHRPLARHPGYPTALTWARAITTRWYDHQQHLTHRWQTRLHHLTAANQSLTHSSTASPALTCRTLITYPETIALAAALTHIPHHGLTPSGRTNFLHHLARQLQLPRLAPATHDPLWARLNTP